MARIISGVRTRSLKYEIIDDVASLVFIGSEWCDVLFVFLDPDGRLSRRVDGPVWANSGWELSSALGDASVFVGSA